MELYVLVVILKMFDGVEAVMATTKTEPPLSICIGCLGTLVVLILHSYRCTQQWKLQKCEFECAVV